MNLIVQRWTGQFDIHETELLANDLVLAQDGNFHPVKDFPSLSWRFPQQPGLVESLIGVTFAALVTVGVVGIIGRAVSTLFPIYNDEPLSRNTRAYVRERDNEVCFYCGVWAVDGHVDHRRSRANGGGNEEGNLTWACISCNCTKGSMNDYEFLDAYEFI